MPTTKSLVKRNALKELADLERQINAECRRVRGTSGFLELLQHLASDDVKFLFADGVQATQIKTVQTLAAMELLRCQIDATRKMTR